MIYKNLLICTLFIGHFCTYAQEDTHTPQEETTLPEATLPAESCETNNEVDNTENTVAAETANKESENTDVNSTEEATEKDKYICSIKIKAVLMRLHSTDREKALQYASALALELQNSTHPIDQELYQILCQYITLAYQEIADNQSDEKDEVGNDTDDSCDEQECETVA